MNYWNEKIFNRGSHKLDATELDNEAGCETGSPLFGRQQEQNRIHTTREIPLESLNSVSFEFVPARRTCSLLPRLRLVVPVCALPMSALKPGFEAIAGAGPGGGGGVGIASAVI